MLRVKIYHNTFGGHFVLNDTLTDQHMLNVLAMQDPSGSILDGANGNVPAAFCIFLGQRLYECKQIAKVNLEVSFTKEFTNRFGHIATLCVDNSKPWDFELEEFVVFPEHRVERVEDAA
ncbi:hypothetical protein [Pseudoalteromonas luteoviolacea]|uniref:Uncharacterized protein n=1 Tax=Pseudoalteromonas luteoviolacea (strain 2ta16) TaxID=1353533 RepID=V4I474_PSEL2|nr:hypothetical protein [Pseudoalteromonas luteoviolacea]ESP95049.1 hypothetical protein PL2TA16_04605 [Pseudoalteromonas luteoviolacea 2ta16]KZN34160.1 hypothetical protein N483_25440 [Pseudoalteromonas luteoviolacea NCIMB 1944]